MQNALRASIDEEAAKLEIQFNNVARGTPNAWEIRAKVVCTVWIECPPTPHIGEISSVEVVASQAGGALPVNIGRPCRPIELPLDRVKPNTEGELMRHQPTIPPEIAPDELPVLTASDALAFRRVRAKDEVGLHAEGGTEGPTIRAPMGVEDIRRNLDEPGQNARRHCRVPSL
jgi:hypothetical protein